MMMTETVDRTTFQTCNLESPEGKKFLRKVIRECESLSWNENWGVRANPRTNWHLEFSRTVVPEIGECERTITVMTRTEVWIDYKAGEHKSFSDSKPVYMMGCQGIWLQSYYVKTLCALLLHKKPRLSVQGSSGSSSSSEFGLSFYSLQIATDDLGGCVTVGSDSVAVHGRRVCSGSVDI